MRARLTCSRRGRIVPTQTVFSPPIRVRASEQERIRKSQFTDPQERELRRRDWAAWLIPFFIREEIAPLRTLLRRTSDLVAIDVGANKGWWSKALLDAFPGGVARIKLVEPHPYNVTEIERLDDNLVFAAEDFAHLRVHAFAAGAAPRRATLYCNDEGSPLASVYPHDINGFELEALRHVNLETPVEVAMDTIDALIARESLSHVDVLKLDIEGHEFDALQGAQAALRSGVIDVVAFEFGSHQVESRHFFKDFYQLFTDLGFDLFFVRAGALEPVERYSWKYEDFTTDHVVMARRRVSG